MNKIKTVVKFEVVRQLKKPSFWVSLLLLPLIIIGFMCISALSGYSMGEGAENELSKTSDHKIGITDNANVVADVVAKEKDVLKIYKKDNGIDLLKEGKIDEYYFIPEDFAESKKVEAYIKQEDDASLLSSNTANITNILTMSSATRVLPKDIVVLSNMVQIETTTYNAKGEVSNLLGKAIIPIMVLAVFYILICVFGNRMLMAVVEEKENRISEMILTALSSKQLIIGKIIALILLGFLQMAVFLVPVGIIAFIYRDNTMISGILSNIEFDPITVIANLALLVFSYFLFTGAATLVGAMMPTARDASQYIGIVMIGMVLPLMFLGAMISSEPSFMTYFLSYFPLSAPIAMMLRNAFGLLPWYEFVIGIVEIGAFSMIIIYLAAKVFQKNAINFSIAKISLKRPFGRKKRRA